MTNPVETETFIEVDDSTMRVVVAGEGDVVVLGHSFLWDAEMWRPQIQVLARDHRVVVPELWGHGGSGPMPPDVRDLRDVARHHRLMLDRLGIERFTIVGHSVGGMWATELALEAPDRVQGLVLMNTFTGPEPTHPRERYFAMLDVVEASGMVPSAVLDAVVPMFFATDVAQRHPELPLRFWERLANWNRHRLLDSVVPLGRMIFGRENRLDVLSRLRMPALVVAGGEDVARPAHEGQTMALELDCGFIEVPSAGHVCPLEAPDAVTSVLRGFLADVRGVHGT
ncbi:alpha/beta fold hydrolase [Marinivivus vitaminiproducens]|uniref:alpha/beta fold hydrolase n=1 Tax=Marinivivus vitaminiproducens TaxID=3035935 RepID=UPI00279DCF7C|nr:alpha/beta fold hydrolase [Geminicoccaceae bacterium SCSIO 64248]